MLEITQSTVAICQERIDHTEELTPQVDFKANVQLYTIKALHEVSCYWGPEKEEWPRVRESFLGAGAKELEDGGEFCLLPHTHGHFPATGNKNYHVRTVSQLIWKTMKNGQGYGGRGDHVREMNIENKQQQNQHGEAHANGRFVIVTTWSSTCS